jgi:hypothetical protein
MTTLGEQGFDICLQAGTTTGVVAGETEDNGARAVDIHGARAYHQTPSVGATVKFPGHWGKDVPIQRRHLTKATALFQCFALERPF